MTILPTLTLLVALAQTGGHPPAAAEPKPERVAALIRDQMTKRRIPGLQLAVVRDGRIVLLRAFGVANIQDSIRVDDRTRFTINSITKAFAGVAIMQLADAGKIDVGAPVSRYLDGLPAAWQPVTVRQLLTNSSGIPNLMDNNVGTLIGHQGIDTAWVRIQAEPMAFPPGDRFDYSQTNWVLIGKILDKLSGRPFAELIATRQFAEVGMPLTLFADTRDIVPHSARGYSYLYNTGTDFRRGERLGQVSEEFAAPLRTAAGITSTAQEMAKWVIALQQGKLIQKSSLATLWTPGRLNDGSTAGFGDFINGYALGWPFVSRKAHPAAAALGGARSAVFVYPDDDLALVVLTNLQGSNPEAFMDELAALYIPGLATTK